MSDKQDRTGARTAADIERKFGFNKSFAEVMGIANDARTEAEKASKAVVKLDEKLDAEEVFNRLTENGKLQGLFKDENGEVYINARYIKALEELFAKDLIMTGKFINKANAFIAPGENEIETIRQHLLGVATISNEFLPFYDTNNDGQITLSDMANMRLAQLGLISLADTMSSAKTSEVTLTIDLSNPAKLLNFKGKNMWGREIDSYVGIDFTSVKNPVTEQRLKAIEEDITKIKTHLGI